MIRLNTTYLGLAFLLFLMEVLIALFVHDDFVRPYVGDILVVMLMYCFLRAFLNIGVLKVAIGVLLFAFVIEMLQYFHLVERLHLEKNRLVKTVLGSSFSWADIVCYLIGFAIVLFVENLVRSNKP